MNKLVLITCFTLLAVSGTASAADYEAGKKKAEVCATCHGADGNKPLTPETPRLGGQ